MISTKGVARAVVKEGLVMARKIVVLVMVGLFLAVAQGAGATVWSDGFEGPSLLSGGWTILKEETGVMSLSTDVSHSGQQSAKFTPFDGGQKWLRLFHSLGSLQEGTLSCWFYDEGPGMYVHLCATMGTPLSDYAFVGVQDWDDTYYHATGGLNGEQERTAVTRSYAWHHFEITGTASGVTTRIDDIVTGSVAGDYRFDGVLLGLSGPHYSGPNYYFDDVSFTPIPEPATMSLLVLGGLGMLISRRKKN